METLLVLCLLAAGLSLSAGQNHAVFRERLQGRIAGLRVSWEASQTLLTPDCSHDVQLMILAAEDTEAEYWWPLAMLDSWGKEESMFVDGDNYWEGSFDVCTGYERIWGDEGHVRLPARYTSMGWWSIPYGEARPSYDGIGLCLPQSCNVTDVKRFFITGVVVQGIQVPIGFPYLPEMIEVIPAKTQAEQGEALKHDAGAIGALCVIGLFVLLAAIGTTYDVISSKKKEEEIRISKATMVNGGFQSSSPNVAEAYRKVDLRQPNCLEKLLMAFSITKAASGILNFKQPRGSIACLHGIRFMTFAWILIGHTWQLGIYVAPSAPTISAKFLLERRMRMRSFQAIHQMSIAVETFFILSAMLTTISFLKKLERTKPNGYTMLVYYFHRYWRLTPVYMICLMIYTTLHPYMGSGPWYRGQPDSRGCQTYWWTNLLYINNLISNNGCLGWAWYLACDFQFYVFAPALLFPLFWMPPLGVALITLCACGGIAARGIILQKLYIGLDTDIDEFWDVYVKPWTRCTPYFMGMLLGYFLYHIKFKIRIHRMLILLGWLLGIGCVTMAVYYPPVLDPWPTAEGRVAWETLQRTLFSTGVCWIIFACSTGNGGVINTILSWDGWLPWARLSYVGYQVHSMIIYWFVGDRNIQTYPDTGTLIYWCTAHLVWSLAISLVVSVIFEVPFAAMDKIIFAPLRKKEKKYALSKESPLAETQKESKSKLTDSESIKL